jgi:uncharacterized membrane protein YjjB (DUF3815 family)
MAGMFCGTTSFLASLGVFTYLVMQGHYTSAAVVCGASVLALIGRIFSQRLTTRD